MRKPGDQGQMRRWMPTVIADRFLYPRVEASWGREPTNVYKNHGSRLLVNTPEFRIQFKQ